MDVLELEDVRKLLGRDLVAVERNGDLSQSLQYCSYLADENNGQDNHDPVDHAIAQFHAEEGFRFFAVTTAVPADSVIVYIVVVKAHSCCLLLGMESVYESAELLRNLSASALRPSIYLCFHEDHKNSGQRLVSQVVPAGGLEPPRP